MLFLLLLSLFVQTSGVSMVLKSQRNLTKTKNMVGELSSADPSKVQDLLGMLQSMMDSAQDGKDQLKLSLENAENARNIAADKHAAAVQAHANSQVALDAARIVKEEADGKYIVAEEATNDAQAARNAANAELQVVTQIYVDAQTFFNTENPRLEHEISVLQDMIALHGNLNNVCLKMVSSSYCNLKDGEKNSLCEGKTYHLTVPSLASGMYTVVKVPSCSDKDKKCNVYNCGGMQVWRIETPHGAFVSAGTGDGMLTCGNTEWTIEQQIQGAC